MGNAKGEPAAKRRRDMKKEPKPKETCIHCGKDCKPSEGRVCNKCYSEYTPGMLADLEN